MADVLLATPATPPIAKSANVAAKAALVLLLLCALLDPDQGNLRDKAAGMRAVGCYPLVSFTVPLLWWTLWRDRLSFPWLPDLLITITCFTDTFGNRMDLYDTVVWFDDWMHFMNTGLFACAIVLLTLPSGTGLLRTVERAIAFGATSTIAWELAEYFAFISRTSERNYAYGDTLGDLALGTAGAVVAGVVVHRLWHQSRLRDPPPKQRTRAGA